MHKWILSLMAILAIAAGTASAKEKKAITLNQLATFNHGTAFDAGQAEIVAYDAGLKRLFVINAADGTVDMLDITDPGDPRLVGRIQVAVDLVAENVGGVNSVAVHNGLVAVAVENDNTQANGWAAFYDTKANFLSYVEAGALPDMVTFAPNGRYVLVANEGEPNGDYDDDPEGSVSVIDLRRGVENATVRTADFRRYIGREDRLRAQGVRIFGPGANAAQDLEPEYITVSDDSRRAWVSLQEANALAVIDIKRARVTDILPLGAKDHSKRRNAMDVSNEDDAINIANWPVRGFYMPDAIASYRVKGDTYIVTANEGDSRDYDGFSEEARVADLILDPGAFPDAAELQLEENLGRLNITTANGDTDGDGDFDILYSYGARSFSIWNERGRLVFDSGKDFETITAARLPDDFNSNNDENDSGDSRSDDKGPEPEGVALGEIDGRTYAFIGLERIGGIMVYDISDPRKPRFVAYVNNRDFDPAIDVEDEIEAGNDIGDFGPEGLVFIKVKESPNGRPLLVAGNEISGTTTIYQIDRVKRRKHDDDGHRGRKKHRGRDHDDD